MSRCANPMLSEVLWSATENAIRQNVNRWMAARPHFDIVLCASGATTDFCRVRTRHSHSEIRMKGPLNKDLGCRSVDGPKGKQIAGQRSWHKTFKQAFNFLFGCWHRNLSRPFTLSGR